jgi:hypothetical protein
MPETKDWTWVLQRPCPECGLDTRSLARADIAPIISANAASWQRGASRAWPRVTAAKITGGPAPSPDSTNAGPPACGGGTDRIAGRFPR